jgi:hypothetical protein
MREMGVGMLSGYFCFLEISVGFSFFIFILFPLFFEECSE